MQLRSESFAVIIGISDYPDSWSPQTRSGLAPVPAVYSSALELAKLLLLSPDLEKLHLFVAAKDLDDARNQLASHLADGRCEVALATEEHIFSFLQNRIPDELYGDLLVFWLGHGCEEPNPSNNRQGRTDAQHLFCTDSALRQPQAISAASLSRWLETGDWDFTNRLFFVDACRTKTPDIENIASRSRGFNVGPSDFSFFRLQSTSHGDPAYVNQDEGFSFFSRELASLLPGVNFHTDIESAVAGLNMELKARFKNSIRNPRQTPFFFSQYRDGYQGRLYRHPLENFETIKESLLRFCDREGNCTSFKNRYWGWKGHNPVFFVVPGKFDDYPRGFVQRLVEVELCKLEKEIKEAILIESRMTPEELKSLKKRRDIFASIPTVPQHVMYEVPSLNNALDKAYENTVFTQMLDGLMKIVPRCETIQSEEGLKANLQTIKETFKAEWITASFHFGSAFSDNVKSASDSLRIAAEACTYFAQGTELKLLVFIVLEKNSCNGECSTRCSTLHVPDRKSWSDFLRLPTLGRQHAVCQRLKTTFSKAKVEAYQINSLGDVTKEDFGEWSRQYCPPILDVNGAVVDLSDEVYVAGSSLKLNQIAKQLGTCWPRWEKISRA